MWQNSVLLCSLWLTLRENMICNHKLKVKMWMNVECWKKKHEKWKFWSERVAARRPMQQFPSTYHCTIMILNSILHLKSRRAQYSSVPSIPMQFFSFNPLSMHDKSQAFYIKMTWKVSIFRVYWSLISAKQEK